MTTFEIQKSSALIAADLVWFEKLQTAIVEKLINMYDLVFVTDFQEHKLIIQFEVCPQIELLQFIQDQIHIYDKCLAFFMSLK